MHSVSLCSHNFTHLSLPHLHPSLQFMLNTSTRKGDRTSENMSKSETKLYGILQATYYARKWTARDPETDTTWIFVDNQAVIRRSLSPVATADNTSPSG